MCRSTAQISKVIRRVAWRYGENSFAVIEDLVQDTYAKLWDDNCRILKEFQPRHENAFMSFLQVVASNVARDEFRRRFISKRSSGQKELELSEIEGSAPDKTSGPNQIERELLLHEINRILDILGTEERDRQVFWLHNRHGFTAASIAQIDDLGLTPKGVESILRRLRLQLSSKLAETSSYSPLNTYADEGVDAKNTLSKGEGQS